jgi:ABC-type sugar transport system substrate-binding protein
VVAASARGRELGAAVGVGDRGRDELGEALDALLGVRRNRLGLRGGGDHHAPQPAVDDDRASDGRPDAEAPNGLGRAPGDLRGVVGGDRQRRGREVGADAMAALVDRDASVAVITGIPGDVGSGLRARGFTEGTRGRFHVVATIAADFEREKARLAAEDVLRADPDIEGFFAVNDLMALGVADAVRAAGRRGEVEVIGLDGIRQALAAVRRGALSATVAQYPYTMGQLGVEACLAAVRGEAVPATVDAPIQVVTSENVARAQANFPKPVEPFDDPFAASLEE